MAPLEKGGSQGAPVQVSPLSPPGLMLPLLLSFRGMPPPTEGFPGPTPMEAPGHCHLPLSYCLTGLSLSGSPFLNASVFPPERNLYEGRTWVCPVHHLVSGTWRGYGCSENTCEIGEAKEPSAIIQSSILPQHRLGAAKAHVGQGLTEGRVGSLRQSRAGTRGYCPRHTRLLPGPVSTEDSGCGGLSVGAGGTATGSRELRLGGGGGDLLRGTEQETCQGV